MKIKFALIPLAAAIAITAAPALAKSKTHHKTQHRSHQSPAPSVQAPVAPVMISRNVSDPSFGNRVGYDRAKSSGRCVADLGYGRYEYCGW